MHTPLTPEALQRDALIQSLLGKTVNVVIDRPIGFVHVTHGITLRYTVNYGYIPGLLAGDGEEQDVYVLGVNRPLSRFTGRIIGAVRRADDVEDKLVAAPEGMFFHQGQIAQAVHFVEQYFTVTIDSVFRKSCGVIVFRRQQGKAQYLLLLQQRTRTWSFPKGHMEAGETERETALRELSEETGLTATLCPGFRASVEYRVAPHIRKQVVLFLGEIQGTPCLQESEIKRCCWVSLTEAKKLLHPGYSPVLEQAEAFEQSGPGGV